MRPRARIQMIVTAVLAIWVVISGMMEAIRQRRRPFKGERDGDEAAPPPPSPERRRLLSVIALGGAGTGALIVGVPVIGFIVAPPLRDSEEEWQVVGSVDNFLEGEVRLVEFLNASPVAWSGPAARSASWLWRRNEEDFVAYKVNCTHLGCPVRWEEGAEFFMCPCHGGVFFRDGEVAAGPPKKPLQQYATRVRNGMVEVRPGPVPITGEILP